MKRTDPAIKWQIAPENVWSHFISNRQRLANTMDVVCDINTEDSCKLFVTASFEGDDTRGGDLMLSLENNDTVIDSAVLIDPNKVPDAIDELLSKV